jgi:Tol biopolymer transport system component
MNPAEVELMRVAADNGRTTTVARLSTAYLSNTQLSLDGRTMVFVAREKDRDCLKLIASSGGSSKTIVSVSDASTYLSSPAWAPDGKAVFYGKQASWGVISMLDNFK